MVKHTQTIRRQKPTNCLSMLVFFVGLAFKGLNKCTLSYGSQFLQKFIFVLQKGVKIPFLKFLKTCMSRNFFLSKKLNYRSHSCILLLDFRGDNDFFSNFTRPTFYINFPVIYTEVFICKFEIICFNWWKFWFVTWSNKLI